MDHLRRPVSGPGDNNIQTFDSILVRTLMAQKIGGAWRHPCSIV